MKVRKVFNNNAIVATDETLRDVVVLGAGIGFQKKINDEIDEKKIERTYVFEEDSKKRFEESLRMVPTKYFLVTTQIVEKAEKELGIKFNSEVFISISDHIAFAIRRHRENVYLPNIILDETKILYKKEFKIGLWAIQRIKEQLHVTLEEDEAGYIALHLVNYSLNNQQSNATKVLNFTREVVKIIEFTSKVEFKKDSLAYLRLSTHLKYLGERIFRNEIESMDTTLSIRDLLNQDVRLYMCINRIKKLIVDRYDYSLSPDEETYLIIHIKNNLNMISKTK